ncbi:MAG TPA: hypothetical protein PK854_04145 [Oscillospiraceae bacterium]|nr:hypothetical protein [Oscillospiraceae bacterium]HPS34437.1 hypothetical protein [Oscillospiraceae bacterium]
MRILTDENIFKSSYFKNICPGYEQFFEPEKLFSRLTDDPAEIGRRQNILRDLLGNPMLFEDLCFISDAVMQFKSSFDELPNHDLGDFRLNLECFNDADGVVGLVDRFLKTAEYAKQYPWLNGFRDSVREIAQRHSAQKMIAAWEQAFVPEIVMHACDFGFNFDDVLWPVKYKLLAMREQEYSRKNTAYRTEPIKIPLIDRIQGTMTAARSGQLAPFLSDGNGHPFHPGTPLNDVQTFGKDGLAERMKIDNAAHTMDADISNYADENKFGDAFLLKVVGCELMEGYTVFDAPGRIKYFVMTLAAELEPLVTEFVPYLCAAKTALYWHEKEIPYCIPAFGKVGEISITGLIDPYVAQNEGIGETIENSVCVNKEIAVVTGANRGGKTAFVTSVTLCQILFQLGFPVPAVDAELGVFSGIVSVFAGEEQGLIGIGRLGEELKKLADGLFAAQTGNVFICFNEPLTGTSSRDGERILAEALCMLKEAGASGFVVTHLLGLAKTLDIINQAGGSPLVTLTAQTDGDRPLYKIIPAPPAESSHAKAVVKRFIS